MSWTDTDDVFNVMMCYILVTRSLFTRVKGNCLFWTAAVIAEATLSVRSKKRQHAMGKQQLATMGKYYLNIFLGKREGSIIVINSDMN